MPAARGVGRRSELRTGEETGGRAELALCRRTDLDPGRSGMVSAAAEDGRAAEPSVAIFAGRHRTPVAGRARPRPCSRHLQSSVQFFPLPPGQHARVFHRGIVIRSELPLTLVCAVFKTLTYLL